MIEKADNSGRGYSIYEISLPKDGLAIAALSAVVVIGYGLGPLLVRTGRPCNVAGINRLDRLSVNNAGRVSDVGSYVTEVFAAAWPAYWSYRTVREPSARVEDLVVALETFMANAVLDITVKTLVQRPQPRLCSGRFPDLISKAAGYRSFYSGHTSQATAMLMVPAVGSLIRRETGRWPWFIAAAGSAFMSFQRVRAGRHFFSDVAVGTLVGVVIGVVVPALHLLRRRERA